MHHLVLTRSLEDGAIGYTKGDNISIANTQSFFFNSMDNETPDTLSQRSISKLYTDISISYTDTTPQNPGPRDEYQLEELPDGWRFNVRLVKY